MSKLLSITNLSKSYGKNQVLKNISFDIFTNDFVALIGNNGAGKSTLINLMCKLISSDNGDIKYFDSDGEPNSSYKKHLGITLDSSFLVNELNSIEYLKFMAEFQGISSSSIPTRITDLIELFDISEPKKDIGKLSSGNKMKVALAASFLNNPEILILDEPYVNLDIKTIQNLTDILKSFKNTKTLLITSHNLDLVVDLCDRFLIMENGVLVAEIKNEENLSSSDLKKKIKGYLTSSNYSIERIDWLK